MESKDSKSKGEEASLETHSAKGTEWGGGGGPGEGKGKKATSGISAGVAVGGNGKGRGAGVHVEDGAGDLGGFVAEEIEDGVGEVEGSLFAAESESGSGFVEVGGIAAFAFLDFQLAFGEHPTGNDVVDADAIGGKRAGESTCEGEETALCGSVGDEIGQALDAVNGTHVDDAAGFGLAHGGNGVLAAIESAAEIDVENPIPKLGGGGFEIGAREPAGVVDETVESGEGFQSGVEEGGDLRFGGDVGVDVGGFGACGAEGFGGTFAERVLNIGEDDGSAFGGGELCATEADALRGPGDDDDFALQAVGHGMRSSGK